MKQKIQTLQTELSKGLINRDDEIKASLLTMIAGENIVLVGLPGTGKSMVARKVAEALAPMDTENDYFEYLLTKFSTPEEIFTILPTARVAFFDKIFQANSSILNALLMLLNERKYYNGTKAEKTPLQTVIAASSELPNEQAELSALYDRFLVRKMLDYVDNGDMSAFFNLAKSNEVANEYKLTQAELDAIREKAENVVFSDDVQQAIMTIWAKHKEVFKDDAGEFLSDRKLVKTLYLLRVSALTNERDEVDFSDVFLLKDCLWNSPDNIVKVHDLIKNILDEKSAIAETTIKMSKSTTSAITGYKGNGTADDPILIGTVDELLGLQRENIGRKGYHFKQIADINCSVNRVWREIDFIGHYNGDGYSIIHSDYSLCVFNDVMAKSVIENLKVVNFSIAKQLNNSVIKNCQAQLTSTHIKKFSHTLKSGIADSAEDSQIENCFVSGDISNLRNIGDGTLYFSGFVGRVANCQIRNCTLGKLQISQTQDENDKHENLATNDDAKNLATAQDTPADNQEIDSPTADQQDDESQHTPVGTNELTQMYFENTLEWDFEKIWEWDGQTNEPKLRKNAQSVQLAQDNDAKQLSFLEKQIKNNIWL